MPLQEDETLLHLSSEISKSLRRAGSILMHLGLSSMSMGSESATKKLLKSFNSLLDTENSMLEAVSCMLKNKLNEREDERKKLGERERGA